MFSLRDIVKNLRAENFREGLAAGGETISFSEEGDIHVGDRLHISETPSLHKKAQTEILFDALPSNHAILVNEQYSGVVPVRDGVWEIMPHLTWASRNPLSMTHEVMLRIVKEGVFYSPPCCFVAVREITNPEETATAVYGDHLVFIVSTMSGLGSDTNMVLLGAMINLADFDAFLFTAALVQRLVSVMNGDFAHFETTYAKWQVVIPRRLPPMSLFQRALSLVKAPLRKVESPFNLPVLDCSRYEGLDQCICLPFNKE